MFLTRNQLDFILSVTNFATMGLCLILGDGVNRNFFGHKFCNFCCQFGGMARLS